MKEITVAKWDDYTILLVIRNNGTGYWRLDDGWVCDYPIMYDNGSFGFDNPEYFPAEVIERTKDIISKHGTKILEKISTWN